MVATETKAHPLNDISATTNKLNDYIDGRFEAVNTNDISPSLFIVSVHEEGPNDAYFELNVQWEFA